MSIPVLTAVGDPAAESAIATLLDRPGAAVHVLRRCVDLPDLLSAAAAGLGRAALVSADLRRLDREALNRLAVAGVAVVGVTAGGDAAAERRLRGLGVRHLVSADGDAEAVEAVIVTATHAQPAAFQHGLADPRLPVPPVAVPAPLVPPDDAPPPVAQPGRLVAVWGPAGAPGRTTLAVGVAAELAHRGVSTMLVDADVYGGSVAQLLGLLDEAPGLAAGCRLANNGSLDAAGLAELAAEVRPSLRVLSGITRAHRWPELRPSGLEVVLDLCRNLAAVTVVDCGFCLERDEELSFDTAAPRRNGATLTALAAADTILAVAGADPVGLQRFVRALGDLSDVAPGVPVTPVVNRVRPGVVGGGDPRREIGTALVRYAGVQVVEFVPLDTPALDQAVAAGRTLPEAAPASPVREPLRRLAASVAGLPDPRPRRRLLRR